MEYALDNFAKGALFALVFVPLAFSAHHSRHNPSSFGKLYISSSLKRFPCFAVLDIPLREHIEHSFLDAAIRRRREDRQFWPEE